MTKLSVLSRLRSLDFFRLEAFFLRITQRLSNPKPTKHGLSSMDYCLFTPNQ
ncbi:hypothetical protein C943_02151 [Mariniradius saccharolyticus AK6]|uniref:Uncharacterized protein n=1 Tax=Mariniradius saccharolyticus AK6 TaxID=1239962 RepID=M7Y2Q5_9BACT|nr:hypothetical protein C943_02151 [Mariniradius saccharolyticus AK6]